MLGILANTATELQKLQDLMGRSLPTYRQAYSDRTAWLMASLSELAYLRFNPIFQHATKDYFLANISRLIDDEKKSSLLKLIDRLAYDHEKEKHRLIDELGLLDIQLITTFDQNGTQAILVGNTKFIVLAFRGTEATSIQDIKSDAKAVVTGCDSGGNIHSGFNEAYNAVALDIQNVLSDGKHDDRPLFITGHSLGGALATIAAKKLTHKGGIAGCYTFGAPRVGDEEWGANIKTPIHRLVNAADCVTMLPPGEEVITALGWAVKFIPWAGQALRSWLLAKFGGYLHCGNMRYLTNCKKGQYQNVKLLYSVSLIYRIKALIVKELPWNKTLADHSISVYRKKLFLIALRRTQPDQSVQAATVASAE